MANRYSLGYDLGTNRDDLEAQVTSEPGLESILASGQNAAPSAAAPATAAAGHPYAAIGLAVLGNVLKDIQMRRQMALKAREGLAESQASPYIRGQENPGLAMLSKAYSSGYGR